MPSNADKKGSVALDRHRAPGAGDPLPSSEYEADRVGYLAEGTARYGDFWEFAPHIYVAAGPELTREVFRRTGAQFSPSRGAFPLPRGVRRALTPGTLLPENLNAARRCFRHSGTAEHTATVAAEAAALARDWPRGRPEEVMPRLKRTFSRIGAEFCFGADAGALTHAEAALARTRDTIPASTLYLPQWVPTATRLRMRRRINALAGRISAVMEQRSTQGRAVGPDLLSAMIQASSDHRTPPGAPIAYLLATILVATQEMPTRAGAWLLLNLARHPRWAEHIAAEAAALPHDGHQVDTGHVARLRTADAFVRETLRLYPPNWLTSRVVVRPTRLGGHRLVPGDRVMVSPYLLHRDERHHDRADTFAPERWLGASFPGTTGAYLPFGAGPRLCPGASLASLELVLVLAMTARAHRLSCPEPRPYRLDTVGALTPAGLRLVFHPRG